MHTINHSPRIGFFVFFCGSMLGASIISSVKQYDRGKLELLFMLPLAIFTSLAFFAVAMYFFLVTHAISLCYDDWTAKMLSATTGPLRKSVKVNLLIRT